MSRVLGAVAVACCAVACRGVEHRAPAPQTLDVPEIYPTAPGGRTWSLPGTAQASDGEWVPEGHTTVVTEVSPGVFRTEGNAGQVRLGVHSPAGRAWWRNVELTAYLRGDHLVPVAGQSPHWELMARGERHSSSGVDASAVNDGVAAPAGTVAWPGYPFGAGPVNPHCLGTAYHANVYPSDRAAFEKELSHVAGYGSAQRGTAPLPDVAMGQWFGVKFVLRDVLSTGCVHLELWVDARASGEFSLVTEADDCGGWEARTADMDGCALPPFGYATDQRIAWAGPWIFFRSDGMATDFAQLGAREIAPAP